MAQSDHLSTLKKLYYDPAYGLLGKAKFIQKVKRSHPDIPTKVVKEFVDKQALQQVNKKKPFKGYYKINAPPKTFQIDLFFLPKYKSTNNNISTFFIAVDILSKKMFMYPMKGRTKDDIMSVVTNFIEEHKPSGLSGDDEFNMKGLREMLLKTQISLTTDVAADDHFSKGNKLGVVDSATRTIKKMIDNYIISNDSTAFVKDLPKIVANYNDSPHSSLDNKTPDEVYEDKDYQMEMQMINAAYNSALESKVDIDVGDFVRVSVDKSKFQKQTITFSPDLYVVSDKDGYKYRVIDEYGVELKRKYKYFELLKVDPDAIEGTATTSEQKKITKLDKQVRDLKQKEESDKSYSEIVQDIQKIDKYDRGRYDFRSKPTTTTLRSGTIRT